MLKTRLCGLLFFSLFWPFSQAGAQSPDHSGKFVFREPKMGSPFIITLYGNDSAKAAAAAHAAFQYIDHLNAVFSDYLDSSELNRLCHTAGSGKAVPVSAELFDILWRSAEAFRLSRGRFDITAGPLVRLWRAARRRGVPPPEQDIEKAMACVGFRHLRLNSQLHQAALDLPGMSLDLGGIAKGYAAQAALNRLQEAGFPAAMVDAGGDLAVGSAPPGREKWRIAMGETQGDAPPPLLQVSDLAVATSGDLYQYLEWNGRRYSHIIDPTTGWGISRQRTVTVVATDGATADWLASACSILPLSRARKLIRHFPGAAFSITERQGDRIRVWRSKTFHRYLSSAR